MFYAFFVNNDMEQKEPLLEAMKEIN